ncbi:hypothetical protein FPOAC2_10093 [Fusarium poae]|jgi:hypothetical protein|uniref:Uncharacterized protein n=1 Tax=Fusarium poae TaxID=36050 RepID=A0A1B8AQV4_FUSPO|nr:hypothetical protein FPOAC1_007504 [Fusarium poae]KAG8668135.1 hypothetical protein FPOAC1_007504 [Fusarium poae]OBS22932.1 hypothetical protein FPOA_09253 [Fusarium poae]
MAEHNSHTQDPVQSVESSTDSAADTTDDSQAESPTLGWANAPPSHQVVHGVPILGEAHAPPPGQSANVPANLSHNQSTVELHNFPCSSLIFNKPTTHQQYRILSRTTDIKKERLERELFEVMRVLRSFSVSEEEFQAALAEYSAIKHEILKLDLEYACVRRAWMFVLEERERLVRLGEGPE